MNRRWALGWLALAVTVLVYEAAGLVSPGEGDTLSEIVRELVGQHPETAGGVVAVLLAWLGWHWLVAPLWRGRQGDRGDDGT